MSKTAGRKTKTSRANHAIIGGFAIDTKDRFYMFY